MLTCPPPSNKQLDAETSKYTLFVSWFLIGTAGINSSWTPRFLSVPPYTPTYACLIAVLIESSSDLLLLPRISWALIPIYASFPQSLKSLVDNRPRDSLAYLFEPSFALILNISRNSFMLCSWNTI